MLNSSPYLHFNGKAEEAMNFYKSILGGVFTIAQKFKDTPGGEKMSSPQHQERFIHISLQISPALTIMASDTLESGDQELVTGTNFHICIHTESEVETEKLFEGLSKNGRILMPLNKTFWGAYFGMCRDKFGVQWMFNYLSPQKQG